MRKALSCAAILFFCVCASAQQPTDHLILFEGGGWLRLTNEGMDAMWSAGVPDRIIDKIKEIHTKKQRSRIKLENPRPGMFLFYVNGGEDLHWVDTSGNPRNIIPEDLEQKIRELHRAGKRIEKILLPPRGWIVLLNAGNQAHWSANLRASDVETIRDFHRPR